MEKILLGVTGVWAEMGLGELFEPFSTYPAVGEVELLQSFPHPDIDRERGLEPVREQQDAIGDLSADAGQFHQSPAGGFDRRSLEMFELKLAAGDRARGFQQVGGPETHFAGTQVRLRCPGESFG